jgi:subtilisin-like proprotein convertase family protein
MSPQACAATTAVFGFQVGADAAAPQQFAEAQIYQCKELVASKIDPGSGLDYSIFKVDRVVSVAAPLPLRKTGHPRRHDRLTALAYPHGGPLKVINGGQIRSIDLDKTFFVANIDGFTGNSGSPVIGVEGTVEGIIVRGAESYAQEDGCLRAIHCAEDECRGEDVLMTREFFGQLATPGPAIVLTNVAVNESLGNGNGLPEPGETLDLSLTIKNQGLARAAKASITLFGQAQGVRFDGVPEGLSDLEPGALQVIHGVRMKLPQTIECGRLRVYAFTRTGESPSVSSHVQFDLGRTVYERFDVASNVTLPEVMPDGQAFDVDILGAPTSRRVLFDVGIRHERPRQLVIEAKAPDGQTALLYKNGLSHVQWPPNAGPQTVNGVYGLSLEPFEDISNFRTVKAPGTWTITVRDVGRGYAAQIDSLSILFGEQKCEPSR